MRFLCLGAGAIGTYFGVSLQCSGQDVVYLERPEAAEKIRANGQTVVRIDGQVLRVEHPVVLESAAELAFQEPFDAAILAVKSFDTAELIHQLIPMKQNIPPILCLQNGVENEPLISNLLGSDRVIAGTVTTAIGKNRNGSIQVERLRGMGVSDGHPMSAALVTILDQAGLRAALLGNAQSMKWSKMFTNLVANASSAIFEMTPAEIFADRSTYLLEVNQLRETLQVMAASGIKVMDLPGTPVRLLAFAIRSLPNWLSQPLLVQSVGKARGGKMPSFYIDFHSGRGKTEVDYLNGAVVRQAQKVGVKVPVNNLLNLTLQGLADGKLNSEDYRRNPLQLIRKLDEPLR